MHAQSQHAHAAYRRPGYWLSVVTTAAMLSFLPGSAGGIASPQPIPKVSANADPVIAAAGDISCDPASSYYRNGDGTSTSCRQKYTSNLLVNTGLTAVLDLGDNQYYCGGYEAFQQAYDPTWGRVKSITHPAVGNHEYLTSGGTGCDITNEGGAGYFEYFGAAAGSPGKGYYSFDIGAWHIVALNSSCPQADGCGNGSPQYEWLQSDMAAHQNACTLAYWHIPLFSSGGRASSNTKALWQLLYNYNADVVLSGHDHIYERFAPQDASGNLDTARGLREFVVGTGGSNHTSIEEIAPNSDVRDNTTFGVLRLTLHQTSYDWQFVHEIVGSFSDSGSAMCHGLDRLPPSAPTGLVVSGISSSQVSLKWNASTDNVGVVGYKVFRNGAQIASVNTLAYADKSVRPETTYEYYVAAYDAAKLISSPSNTVSATTPAVSVPTPTPTPQPATLFLDGFETGSMSKWNSERGMVVESQIVAMGQYAARATGAGNAAFARRQLGTPESDLYYRIRFYVLNRGRNGVNLLRFQTSTGVPILTFHISASGQLGYWNNLKRRNVNSLVTVRPYRWQTLQVHVHIAGSSSRIDTWYNNMPVTGLSRMEALGISPIGRVQLGEQRTGLTFDIVFDGVVVSLAYVGKAPAAGSSIPNP